MEKLDGKTLNLVKENISALKSLFPEAFSEEKIDFDKLRLLLGDEVETSSEKYSFNWHGKSEAIKLALKQSSGTLKPCVKDSKNWDTTKNLYIEGDNLEVLRILQGAYQNKVKMIYIDPPYNTGKDFVYKDSFKDNIKNYKEQVQETGKANPETAGRYHTNWLNMMYPRLKLARNLLKDDGVIFISIDDHEVHNLRKICDEIFGEENFIGCFIWKRRVSSAMSENNISTDHEYVTVYQKSFSSFSGLAKDFNKYTNPDNDQRGPWIADNLTVGMTASMRPNQAYNLIVPETKISYPYNPNRVWAYIPSSMDQLIAKGRIIFPKDNSKYYYDWFIRR
ncbi:MAG: site-specific DNA-methyltransferase [Proteobacteria bacterium]|nr:site-specific DNA-methyltransferase [Pseudomonadota bacterium]